MSNPNRYTAETTAKIAMPGPQRAHLCCCSSPDLFSCRMWLVCSTILCGAKSQLHRTFALQLKGRGCNRKLSYLHVTLCKKMWQFGSVKDKRGRLHTYTLCLKNVVFLLVCWSFTSDCFLFYCQDAYSSVKTGSVKLYHTLEGESLDWAWRSYTQS